MAGARLSPFTPIINPTYTSDHNYFRVKPQEIALYVQDKIELDELIINAGIRFDYFDPKWKISSNDRFPGNRKYYLVKTPNDTAVFWEYDYSELHTDLIILDSLSEQGAVAMENLFTAGIDFDSTQNTYSEALQEAFDNSRNTYRWKYAVSYTHLRAN